jgi:RNA polymerase sigma factor (sigma-70 family)
MAAKPIARSVLLEPASRLHRPRPVRSSPRPAPDPARCLARSDARHERAGAAARGRALLESHFDLIQARLALLGRRCGMLDHQAEELRSWALFKLVENDYRILAGWQGRSSFSTYLTVVLVNLMRDYRVHIWGKWRPSAVARRQGREAVLLERLWLRDGLSFDEAVERLRAEHGISLSRAQLEQIAARLPRRAGHRTVGEAGLERIPVDGGVESRIENRERHATAARLREVLVPLFHALPAEDRLLLKLHFRDNLTVAAISSLLQRPQRVLYARRERCLKSFRHALERAGIDAAQARDLIGWSWLDLSPGPDPHDGAIWE